MWVFENITNWLKQRNVAKNFSDLTHVFVPWNRHQIENQLRQYELGKTLEAKTENAITNEDKVQLISDPNRKYSFILMIIAGGALVYKMEKTNQASALSNCSSTSTTR